MVCPRCGKDCWDNRTKKMDDPKWAKAPDFSCKDKGCGWKSGLPATPAQAPTPVLAPPSPVSGPSGGPSPRDTLIQELFWDSFDAVLAGIAKRRLVDAFKSEHIASLTATMFIQRSKG